MWNKERDIYVLSKEYLEKCFGWQSPTRDSGLPKQLGCTGSCWHSDMVQVHNPVGVHQIFNLGVKITRTQDRYSEFITFKRQSCNHVETSQLIYRVD